MRLSLYLLAQGGLDLAHMKVVLATLAQFHAAGYSWRKSLQVCVCLTSARHIYYRKL